MTPMTALGLILAYYWGWTLRGWTGCSSCAAAKRLAGRVAPPLPPSPGWVTAATEEECDRLGHHIPPGRELCRCGLRRRRS